MVYVIHWPAARYAKHVSFNNPIDSVLNVSIFSVALSLSHASRLLTGSEIYQDVLFQVSLT